MPIMIVLTNKSGRAYLINASLIQYILEEGDGSRIVLIDDMSLVANETPYAVQSLIDQKISRMFIKK